MMDEHITSEEKLLKLIRKDKKISTKQKDSDQKNELSDKKYTPSKEKKDDLKYLKYLNGILFLIAAGIVGYIFVRFFILNQKEFNFEGFKVKKNNSAALKKEEIFRSTKPFSYYNQVVGQRNIFRSPWEKDEEEDEAEVNETKSAIFLEKQLKVLGIMLDENPKAIIEDLKTKETHFVSKGQEIQGAVVKEIYEDKILFIYNNEEAELIYK